ncbi:MAG: hypothetical protein JWR00_3765 [Rubritepida sp.]|nr:hypothetical protein [Rubritepida sp.]
MRKMRILNESDRNAVGAANSTVRLGAPVARRSQGGGAAARRLRAKK